MAYCVIRTDLMSGTKQTADLVSVRFYDGEGNKAMGFELTDGMMQMMGGFTLLRLTSLVSMLDISFTKEELLDLNAKLNKIKAKD